MARPAARDFRVLTVAPPPERHRPFRRRPRGGAGACGCSGPPCGGRVARGLRRASLPCRFRLRRRQTVTTFVTHFAILLHFVTGANPVRVRDLRAPGPRLGFCQDREQLRQRTSGGYPHEPGDLDGGASIRSAARYSAASTTYWITWGEGVALFYEGEFDSGNGRDRRTGWTSNEYLSKVFESLILGGEFLDVNQVHPGSQPPPPATRACSSRAG